MTEAPEAPHPLLDFFNVVLGGSPGWVVAAFGHSPYRANKGTYRHASFPQHFYQWPTDARQLLADVAAAKETSDVYICPAVRSSPDRRKGSARPPMVCWVDMDQHPTDSALWSQLDPFVIHSGQPGHQHGYIPLTEPIDLDLHERLNKALAERLGGDAKWPENSLLRLPGTYNFKLTVPLNGDAPGRRLPVIPAGHWSGKRWNPRDLAALLGVDLSPTDNGKPRTLALVRTEPGSDDHTAEPVDLDQLPPSITDHLTGDYPVGTRSEALYELVGRCRRAEYTLGQTIAIAETFPPAVDKYGDRLARQVADCWEKIGQPAVTTAPPGLPPHTQADNFWDARPILAHLRDFALSRRASPWATLGVVLARVIAATPYRVVLPPIIGGEASLNLFVALVGESGMGKSGAMAAARDALHITNPNFREHHLGSGQGIAHGYAQRVKGEVVRHTDSVLFDVPEVDTLRGLAEQNGSTLMAEVRKLYMAERLGHLYVDPAKRIEIEPHSYRASLVVGVQPARADVLLDDRDGGTPQRFVWLPVTYPDHADQCPAPVEPYTWFSPLWDATHVQVVMEIPPSVWTEIDKAYLDRQRGRGDPLDGHLLLCQEKVAAALAILAQRTEMTEEDWQLASVIITTSTAWRDHLAKGLTERAQRRNQHRAQLESERAVLIENAKEGAAHARVRNVVLRVLSGTDGLPTAELRRKISGRDRGYVDPALAALTASGHVVPEPTDRGTRYRLATP